MSSARITKPRGRLPGIHQGVSHQGYHQGVSLVYHGGRLPGVPGEQLANWEAVPLWGPQCLAAAFFFWEPICRFCTVWHVV